MTRALMWFRNDLRCMDNPALYKACREHEEVLVLYILDSTAPLGSAQHWWLHHSLQSLINSLQKYQLILVLRQGDSASIIASLIEQYQIDSVYWNRCYEPELIARDTLIKKQLQEQGVDVHSANGSLLNEPWTIKNKEGNYFKVFTPYWKHCLQHIVIAPCRTMPAHVKNIAATSDELDTWQLLPKKPNWAAGFADYWQPGEEGAHHHLELFIDNKLLDYKNLRNVPAKDNTSKLSPHLHFGEISPWQVWRAIEQAKCNSACDLVSADHFLSEIGWREFSYYLLFHFPKLPIENYKNKFDAFPWQMDPTLLTKWQKGLTGYPLIDAGMRELWHTGYMHNRVRMLVASFLIKGLFIDWRVGAEWFFNTLLDADLANNSASWQWVAGSGADAAPYFRIFNPVLQSEKFDPEGIYIKQWVPELRKVNSQHIHQPWLANRSGSDYPKPIIQHDEARKLALHYYQMLGN